MSTQELKQITGIGENTALALINADINSIAALATADPTKVSVPNIVKLIQRANEYISKNTTPNENNVQELKNTIEPNVTHMIQEHTWFELKVLIPSTPGGELKTAVVYELSVDTTNRVSLLCSWVETEDNKEYICDMTYSPQFLFHFNLRLPRLDITLRKEDFEKLPNQDVLTNVLLEVRIMHDGK